MGPPRTVPSVGVPDVRRLKTLRRKREGKENVRKEVTLETVLGVTATSNAGLATAPGSGTIAYPAGCTVVLYNSEIKQQQHIINPDKKTITCVGWSEDGRYLVTGESGRLPCVRVWDIQSMFSMGVFSGHKYGVSCVAFAPNNKYIVSVGSQHDMIVNVWDWRNGTKVASNKVSSQVRAVTFAESGDYFVTAGNRHIKFWYLEYPKSSKFKNAVPLLGRPAILGEQRSNFFCDVACGKGEMAGYTYTVTKSGLLCQFNNQRILDKWVELKTESSSCLSVGEEFILVGCAGGIVRCFSPHTLQFITTLPYPHPLGVDVAQGLGAFSMLTSDSGCTFAEAIAVSFDEENSKLTTIYNDHSIYTWDVKDMRKVAKVSSFLFHSACIWGLDVYHGNLLTGEQGLLPSGSLVTCSSDDTVRIWDLNKKEECDLSKVVYFDPHFAFLKEQGSPLQSSDKDSSYDQKNGVRCLSISPDGEHLASGDRSGNIRVHDLQSMKELVKIEAHDAEVLSLQYSQGKGSTASYLASASRDRLIHVFDAKKHYDFLSTVDDHSSSITAVRFSTAVEGSEAQLVSCGADKSIIFRNIKTDVDGISLTRANQIVGKTTLYDMEMDVEGEHILTACQDRNIRVYSVDGAKQTRVLNGSTSEDGSLIKVVLDRSGSYYATSCTDKSVTIYDYKTGDLMATMTGHSELVTGLAFSHDSHHLISVAGDSCVFVWSLPKQMVVKMKNKLGLVAPNVKVECDACEDQDDTDNDEEQFGSPPPELLGSDEPEVSDNAAYRFSVGKLPAWAKPKIDFSKSPQPEPIDSLGKRADVPRGKWGSRQVEGPPALNVFQLGEDDTGDVSTLQDYPRKTLFEEKDALFDDERVGEFKVNAMDVEELRKSVRKRNVRAEVVRSVSTDEEDDDDVEEEANKVPLQRGFDKYKDSEEYGCLDNTNPDDRRERFLKSTFESLSECLSGNYSDNTRSISNAWREGSTPIQLKRQTRNLQKTLVDNKLTRMRGKSIENLDSIPAQSLRFKHKLASDVPAKVAYKSPVGSSTPDRKTFLQKACSLLDISSPVSPHKSSTRRGSGDSDLPTANSFVTTFEKTDKSCSAIPSRLGQHKQMLAEVKKGKVELPKNSSYQPPLKDRTNHDVPNYMKSTVAKSKKEKVVSSDSVGSQSRLFDQEVVKPSNLRRAESRETLLSAEAGNEARSLECENDVPVSVSREECVAESDVHNVTRGHLSHELVQACAAKMQAAADQLVLVYKRVSLDDDLDDSLREELLIELSEGASQTAGTLTLLHSQDDRSQGEIATAAMATINQFLAKQTNHHHSKIQEILSPQGDKRSRGAIGRK